MAGSLNQRLDGILFLSCLDFFFLCICCRQAFSLPKARTKHPALLAERGEMLFLSYLFYVLLHILLPHAGVWYLTPNTVGRGGEPLKLCLWQAGN